jgi:transcriptional regulator with XRE-family HTH domain
MRPEDIFLIVLERFRQCQINRARITAIRQDACADGDGPPRVGRTDIEFIADFQRAGERALIRRYMRPDVNILKELHEEQRIPQAELARMFGISRSYVHLLLSGKRSISHRGRGGATPRGLSRATRERMLQLFVLRYVKGRQVEAIINEMKINHAVFEFWNEDIMRAVGREFARSGIFPPYKYFHEPEWKHKQDT